MPLRDSRVRETFRLMVPFIFFGVVTRSGDLFQRYFASGLPDGDLSYIGYAAKVGSIVMVVLGNGIIAASFPSMARAFAQRGKPALVEQLEYGLRLALSVSLPALAIMTGAAVPLVAVLFERGAFHHSATLGVSLVLPVVLLGYIVLPTVSNLQTRTFYTLKDTRTVPALGLATSILYIFMAKWLAGAGGYVGLALARPLEHCVSIVVLFLLLNRRLPALKMIQLLKSALMYGTASLVAFLAARTICGVLATQPDLVQLLGATLVAGPLYIAILYGMDRKMALATLEVVGAQRLAGVANAGYRRVLQATQRHS
jgi:putative peptidoglycan lipid II flippase